MSTCVCCGRYIPQGSWHCPICERNAKRRPDVILPDGTPLYLKTTSDDTSGYSIQMELYEMLTRYRAAVDEEDT
jgi:hypothetical protein